MAIPVKPGEVSKSLVCSICLEVPDEPTILKSCSHVFCKGCIHRSITDDNRHYNHNTCPICRSKIGESDVLPLKSNPFAYRLWSEIRVRCEHHPTEGCSWIGSLGDYRSHKYSCAHNIPFLMEENQCVIIEDDNTESSEQQHSKSHSEELDRLEAENEELEYRLVSSNLEKEELKQKIERMSAVIKTKSDLEANVRTLKMRQNIEQVKTQMELEARVRKLERELLVSREENSEIRKRAAIEHSYAETIITELETRVQNLELDLFTTSKEKYELQNKFGVRVCY